MEKRKVEIEYNHFEPGERVCHHSQYGSIYVVVETIPPALENGWRGRVNLDTPNKDWSSPNQLQLAPEPPITDAERVEAMLKVFGTDGVEACEAWIRVQRRKLNGGKS